MIRGWILPATAAIGLVFAAGVSIRTERAPTPAEPVRWPPSPPFESFIAGSGIVEAEGGNITIGAPFPGIVTSVPVDTGYPIHTGEVLFEIDNRPYVANRATAEANLHQAIANLEKLCAYPRPQERLIALSDLEQARAQAKQARAKLQRICALTEAGAVSELDRETAGFSAEAYSAQEQGAMLRLDIAEEGTWEKDLAIAQAAVKVAEAQLARAVVDLAMTRVTSPLDGIVLYCGIDPGNYVAGPTAMVIGGTHTLRVRTDIDEVDAWRFDPSSPAYAFLRGNAKVQIPLQFSHYESLVQPKRSLTLENDERVDTRVLQVIYTFEPGTLPVALYVGQLLDVFIESVGIGQKLKPKSLPAGLEQLNGRLKKHLEAQKTEEPPQQMPTPRPGRGHPYQPPSSMHSPSQVPRLGLHFSYAGKTRSDDGDVNAAPARDPILRALRLIEPRTNALPAPESEEDLVAWMHRLEQSVARKKPTPLQIAQSLLRHCTLSAPPAVCALFRASLGPNAATATLELLSSLPKQSHLGADPQ
jgi:HlyD family secretion protein